MIERLETEEDFYDSVVEPSYKTNWADDNHAGHRRKMREEVTLPNTYTDMSESAGRRRKRYLYHPKDRSKTTCIIHGPGH